MVPVRSVVTFRTNRTGASARDVADVTAPPRRGVDEVVAFEAGMRASTAGGSSDAALLDRPAQCVVA
jgi:hypothetical protein